VGALSSKIRRTEARAARDRERGCGSWEGQQVPSYQLGGLGIAVSSPTVVQGRAPEEVGFRATVCKTVRPMLSDRCLSCHVLSVTLVYCGQTVGWIKMKLGMEVGLGPDHIVLDGDPFNFWPMSIVAKRLNASGQDTT